MRISPRTILRATALLSGLAGCGRATGASNTAPGPDAPARQLGLDQLFVLEMAGIPPEDTVVTFRTGAARTIILRHGAPDNTPFVELRFPADAFGPKEVPDSVTATVRVRPGVYGVDVMLSLQPVQGASIRFKYPVHFSAPIAAVGKYGSTGRYERALSILRRVGDAAAYTMLPSDRPSPDNLRAALAGSGSYLVAAPR